MDLEDMVGGSGNLSIYEWYTELGKVIKVVAESFILLW
jgi:hypothetical protein